MSRTARPRRRRARPRRARSRRRAATAIAAASDASRRRGAGVRHAQQAAGAAGLGGRQRVRDGQDRPAGEDVGDDQRLARRRRCRAAATVVAIRPMARISASAPNAPTRGSLRISSRRARSTWAPSASATSARPSSCSAPVTRIATATRAAWPAAAGGAGRRAARVPAASAADEQADEREADRAARLRSGSARRADREAGEEGERGPHAAPASRPRRASSRTAIADVVVVEAEVGGRADGDALAAQPLARVAGRDLDQDEVRGAGVDVDAGWRSGASVSRVRCARRCAVERGVVGRARAPRRSSRRARAR